MLKTSRPQWLVQPKASHAARRAAYEAAKYIPHATRFPKSRRKAAEREAARLTEATGCEWEVTEMIWVYFG